MDQDLQVIHERWGDLTDLDRGTASWVVETLGDRRRGLPPLPDDVPLEDVLRFLAEEANKVWHCDCCPRRSRSSNG